MKKSDRIKSLMQLAEKREQQAVRDLGQARQQMAAQQTKLEELREYREEYRRRFLQDGEQGISGSQLQHFQAFMCQLDQAIENQHQVVEQLAAQCRQQTDHWQQRHQHTRILDKTRDRFARHERHQAERQEQRENDDLAATRYKPNKPS